MPLGPSTKLHLNQEIGPDFISSPVRPKRDPEHYVDECISMLGEEGQYYLKSRTDPDGSVCAIYLYAEPDQNIEIKFNYLDVSCDNEGLVVVVDGWELNQKIFPNPDDHPKELKTRFTETCGKRKIKKSFLSSQNVALIQYRMPARGSSFSFSVRFVKNPTPCNVLIQSEQVYTLRNYGERANCSISALFPAALRILDINVGVTRSKDRSNEFETGVLHKCQKRGLDDYVQIGGSSGIDDGFMEIADSLCGLSSMPGKYVENIGCDVSSARLVSSGAYDNSITLIFEQLTFNDVNGFMSVVCIPEDLS
ncbi:corticotropin-releasing factor-binding protein isoform X2 [Anthonomus grandis grandis]|nr:corticotropin-releasing factor-binding protein isoform X2 [Anthonomus grandis grandis]